jgi:hypothetical protein
MFKSILKGFYTLVYFSLIGSCAGQDFQEMGTLPHSIDESSGLEIHSSGHQFWTFNDSGGKAMLYLVDSLGKLQRSLEISNAWNRDWEDITRDNKGNIYIGNIGNNSNANKDLCIFKIANPDSSDQKSVAAEVIKFRYEDQISFPPDNKNKYFDCEALMWQHGKLYMVTKNRTKPFDGLTHLYVLPDQPGEHIARKIGSFDTGGKDMYNYWITAGDISSDGKQMVLLSGDKIWLFYDYDKDAFFDGQHQVISLPHSTQKEGICFSDAQTLFLTDEAWKNKVGRRLYRLKL